MVQSSWAAPQKKEHEDAQHQSFNSSFNSSFGHNSANGFPSPRKFSSSTRNSGPKSSLAQDTDFAHAPRFALFDSKAEIEYVPEEDQVAASVYADRKSIKDKPEETRKPRTSGYDFDTLLKDVEVEGYRNNRRK